MLPGQELALRNNCPLLPQPLSQICPQVALAAQTGDLPPPSRTVTPATVSPGPMTVAAKHPLAGRWGAGGRLVGAHGLFILSGISILNSSLFQESQGFGASKHPGPIRRPQPVPTSCVSVTAKNTAHQLPEPCSPGEFLPDQEMPDRGDRVGAAPWPWAQLGASPWSEREGHPGAGRSLGGRRLGRCVCCCS